MMTFRNKILVFVIFLLASPVLTGQINRTLETKVADILAKFPTNDLDHANNLMEDMIGLGGEGILQFCDMLVPLGSGDDRNARYALQSLAVYSGGTGNAEKNNLVETSLLKAIQNASDNETKRFLIARLQFCGTEESIPLLGGLLTDEAVYASALDVLVTIGTPNSEKAILDAAKGANDNILPALVEALGTLAAKSATAFLHDLVAKSSKSLKQKSLMALANIGDVSSHTILGNSAKEANYSLDGSKAILAYIDYGKSLAKNGNTDLAAQVGHAIIKNCVSQEQLHFRIAGIALLNSLKQDRFTKTLIKEAQNANPEYSAAVVDIAAQNLNANNAPRWVKFYKKAPKGVKPHLLRMLQRGSWPSVYEKCIIPALADPDLDVKIAGIKTLAFQEKSTALPVLLTTLKGAQDSRTYRAVEETLLRVCGADDLSKLTTSLNEMNAKGKQTLINVLAARRATAQYDAVVALIDSKNPDLNRTIYAALPQLTSADKLSNLLELLGSAQSDQNVTAVQKAIAPLLASASGTTATMIYDSYDRADQKQKIAPLLALLGNQKGLERIHKLLGSGHEEDGMVALDVLANWKDNAALPYLFQAANGSQGERIRSKAFKNYLTKVVRSDHPDDQKLLLIQKMVPLSATDDQTDQIINAAATIKTFLSLVFVSDYLEGKGTTVATASNAIIRIALPTPIGNDGLSGEVVREAITKSVGNLEGPESQYAKIDVQEFLDNMPKEKGFVPIFNGNDLSGWEGLVKDPITREKMSKNALRRAQQKANAQMQKDWFVKDGIIMFKGEGYNNICTIKDYGDFELLVDWKITKGGDSGIYLRGTPQVQIWDTDPGQEGAQIGSGGLYNNQINMSKPLTVADNPVDEWNTFRIKMVGEKVTVHLNGVLVTDKVSLENYWDRTQPIFTKEAIELQAHGENLGFRNVYVREITPNKVVLDDEEVAAGFVPLFNGKNLENWTGNENDYHIENNELTVLPAKEGNYSNLTTNEVYSDFVLRFEYLLTPGANNGLGFHMPPEGDPAYVAKEVQILDDTAAIYAKLKAYQYNGAVYGVLAPKRGHLNPLGTWNSQEISVQGDAVKITLNGQVIVDGNLREASANGTLDKVAHPGLDRHTGYIAFLGHGSEIKLRNIRIKKLNP